MDLGNFLLSAIDYFPRLAVNSLIVNPNAAMMRFVPHHILRVIFAL